MAFLNNALTGRMIDNAALIKLFVLYRPDQALAENLAVRLKFSRREKQLFTLLAKETLMLSELLNRKKQMKIIYRHDKEFYRASLLTAAAREHKIPEDFWLFYDETESLPEIVFPLSGKDIIDSGLTDATRVGRVLKELEKIWIDSDFDLTKDQLLVQMDNLKNVI